MYFFNYVDRGALAQARLNNLEKDLHMAGDNFNTAVSVLTVGYVLMQIPSNMLLTRVQPSLYLASFTMIWSVVSSMPDLFLCCPRTVHLFTFSGVVCTGFVNSYGSLLACRFLLGFFEAPVSPLLRVFSMKYPASGLRRLADTILQFYPGALYILSIFYTRKGM